MFAIFVLILDQDPDPALTRSAQQHFYRWWRRIAFWNRMREESDSKLEWVPNGAQTSPLGLNLPPKTGAIWLEVLTEFEPALQGSLLLPHWRLGDQAGINLAKFLKNLERLDFIRMLHGAGMMPYAEPGAVFLATA
tara:strand:+ start:1024 stop:1431 length:408 start_codon:yes stop_codon:yes gene_type:complete